MPGGDNSVPQGPCSWRLDGAWGSPELFPSCWTLTVAPAGPILQAGHCHFNLEADPCKLRSNSKWYA